MSPLTGPGHVCRLPSTADRRTPTISDGDEIGCELSEDAAVAGLCASAFASVWERAVPHEEYRPA